MTGTAVVLQLISIFFCCVSGAYFLYGSTRLSGPQPNVTLTVGEANQRVYCGQDTGPVPTSIEWYNPQGQLVSSNNGDEVSQAAAAGGGRTVALTFQSYQQSQGGKYECRVNVSGNNTEMLSVCIGPTTEACIPPTEPPSMPSTKATLEPTIATPSTTTMPTVAPRPSKMMGVRVSPSVQGTSPTLTVKWQALAEGAVTYTVKYSTQPGEVNTPPVRSLEVTGISGTSTILTALERGTTYYIWVVGMSEGGEGPHSDRTSGVAYDIPGPVSELSYEEDTDTSVNITWNPPKKPNGVIAAYFVEHAVHQNESTTSVRLHARRGLMYTVIQGLEPGVPYTVIVRAITAVGKGEPVSIVVFSVEQAPTAQVSNVKVERVNNNNRAALVSWTPLTFHEARGFPVYFVTYQPSLQVGRVARAVNTISTTDSSLVINDLDPTTEFIFAVDVGTAVGKLRSTLAAVSATLPRVESESNCSSPINNDSIGATGVGLFLGGVVAGVIGVLLIGGIVGGACWLRRNKHRSSTLTPSGKAAGEDVPMDDNPAYGVVSVYDNVKEPKEN